MEVIFGLNKITAQRKSVLTVGTFDGVHLGHREIIKQVLDIAKQKNFTSALLTFEPHPD